VVRAEGGGAEGAVHGDQAEDRVPGDVEGLTERLVARLDHDVGDLGHRRHLFYRSLLTDPRAAKEIRLFGLGASVASCTAGWPAR
jgi:hypothetical protein